MSAEAEESAEPQSVILSIKAIAAAFAVCFYAHELLNAIVEQKVKVPNGVRDLWRSEQIEVSG